MMRASFTSPIILRDKTIANEQNSKTNSVANVKTNPARYSSRK